MATNMSDSWATSITIWDPAMFGCSVNRSDWNDFMDGKEAMVIGGTTPFAMTVTERIAMDMFSRGVMSGREKTEGTNIDAHEQPRLHFKNTPIGVVRAQVPLPNKPLKMS